MPLKKGPNNTERHYDPATGRYCRNPLFQNITWPKEKKSFQEREKERMDALMRQAIKSKDKHLYELYVKLESVNPGTTQHINATIYDRNLKNVREIDIITKRAVYEVKSGKAKHKLKQFLAQKSLAESRKKQYVVYSPESGKHQIEALKRHGIQVYNNIEDVLRIEVKHK